MQTIFDQSRLRTQAPVLFGRAHQAWGTLEAPHAVIARVRVELCPERHVGSAGPESTLDQVLDGALP